MVADDLIAVAPPGERRAVPFRGNLLIAILAFLVAVGITALTWVTLRKFDQSLHVNQARQNVARAFEAAVAILVLAVPFYALLALIASLRGESLERHGRRRDAQIAVADSKDRILVVVGLGSSALVLTFLAFLLSANNGAVRDVLFNWTIIWKSRTALLHGFWLNIKLFVVSESIVLVWALLVAVVRLLPGRACAPIRALAIIYTDVFRGIPALITIYLVVFGFALAGVPPFANFSPDLQLFWLGVLALVLVYGAYVAEVYRAGLESVHWSQAAAARSLGLSQVQTLRYVIIPQAVRRILPPLMNDFVALQKDTTLLSIVGIVDILGEATLLKSRFFNLSAVTGASICFLVITIPFTRLTDYLIKRDRQKTMAQ